MSTPFLPTMRAVYSICLFLLMGNPLVAQTAYVTVAGVNNLTPIDIATNTTGTPIPVGSAPVLLAITPDGTTAYVANEFSDNVTPINLATNTPGTIIAVGNNPQGIAITPDGATAYVANVQDDTVTPIDLATNTTGTPIPVGGFPRRIAITPDGATAYVTNTLSQTVIPIDVATNTAGTPVAVGFSPAGVAITPDGTTLYIALDGSVGNVVPMDVATNTVGTPIPVGSRPIELAITPDGTTVYVANFQSDTVTPITIATNTVGAEIPVGDQPRGIAITPDGTTAYVANQGSGTVTPIDIATNTAGTPIPVGDSPRGVTISPILPLEVSCILAGGDPVPAGGGNYFFEFSVTNNSDSSITFDLWHDVEGPGVDRTFGPFGPRTLGAGNTYVRTMRKNVPAGAPSGSYSHDCHVGTDFPSADASDSFAWTKDVPEALAVSGGTEWNTESDLLAGLDGSAHASTDIPGTHVLQAAYPNPFNPETTFQFSVASDQVVRAELVDVLGRAVSSLFSGEVAAHEIQNVRINGANLPSGAYLIRLVGENFVDTQRITLLK